MSDSSVPSKSSGPSTTLIIGLVVIGVALVGLTIYLSFIFIRRRKTVTRDIENAPRMLQVQPSIAPGPIPAHSRQPQGSTLARSVSRKNLTKSIVLPTPLPPVPAARPRPPKSSPQLALHPSGRPLSSAEIVEHHRENGTFPRPFAPFSFALHNAGNDAISPRSSSGSTLPGSTVSISRSSILSPSLRNSLASSLRSSFSSATPNGLELLKVRHLFTPLLPDELVLRLGEKLSLIQSYDDNWCIVGRKSPFHAPSPMKSNGYAFGQGKSTEELEIGAAPAWVFEKHTNGNFKADRPMRSSSLGITLIMNEGAESSREDVISWSNF